MLIFSEYSSPGRVWTEFGTIFFFPFSAYLNPFWLKIIPERGFLIFFFQFFCYFSCNFLARVECERNSGVNIFSPFLSLSHLVFVKNTAEKMFFNFLNYFAFFLAFFFPGPSMNGIQGKNFFHSFSAYLVPFNKLKIQPERGFLFIYFFLFFSQFSCPGRVWTEFGTKFFFIFSQPISSRFG